MSHLCARGWLHEGGVQGPGVLLAEGSGLKQLLDEGRLLLLQLCDPLTLVGHLLGRWEGSQGLARAPQPPPAPPAPAHLGQEPVLLLQHEDGLLLPVGGREWHRTRGPRGGRGQSLRGAQSGRPGTASRMRVRGARAGLGGTHPGSTGRGQKLPQAPGHLLHLGQQLPQQAGAALSPEVLEESTEGRSGSRASPGVQGGPMGREPRSVTGGEYHGREGWPSTLGRGAATVLCPPGQGITVGGGRCARGWGWRRAQGAAPLTELALLWPRRCWRSCSCCSCCWYHSRPRAIISRPCSSTSCSCCSSLICFSCRARHTLRHPRARAMVHTGARQDRMACTCLCLKRIPAHTHTPEHSPRSTHLLAHLHSQTPVPTGALVRLCTGNTAPLLLPGLGAVLAFLSLSTQVSQGNPPPFMARGHSQRVGQPDVPGKQVGASAVPGRG